MESDRVASLRSQLQKNGFALSKSFGTSMRPLIWGGQHCVAVAPLEGEPAIGDLLMFVASVDGKEISIVHRLVEIRHAGVRSLYITRGDNCLGCEQVSRSEIIGRVAEVHRVSGFRPWHVIPARKFAVTDPAYLRYSRLWAATWRIRRPLYQFRSRIYALRSKFKKEK